MGGKESHRLNKGEGAGGSGCLETREESECGSGAVEVPVVPHGGVERSSGDRF
jgi:hypothetical protein